MSSQNNKKGVPKFIWAIIAGVGILLGIRADFPYEWFNVAKLRDYITDLPNLIIATLFIVFSMCVGLLVYYAHKPTTAPKIFKYFLYIGLLSGILLIAQFYDDDKQRKFVIVYDDEIAPFHPENIDGLESQRLEDLNKLYSVGQLDKNTILISTVSNPQIKWQKAFPPRATFNSPIFSLQEVLSPENTGIIDISLLDYSSEITYAIQQKIHKNMEIHIFYEDEYEASAKKLKTNLINTNSNYIINTTNFDKNTYKTLISKNVSIVFLGNLKNFTSSIQNIKNTDFHFLFAPNWLRPSIQLGHGSSNRICATSSVFNNLLSKNSNTWNSIFNIIKVELININNDDFEESVKNKIRSAFATNNHPHLITF